VEGKKIGDMGDQIGGIIQNKLERGLATIGCGGGMGEEGVT